MTHVADLVDARRHILTHSLVLAVVCMGIFFAMLSVQMGLTGLLVSSILFAALYDRRAVLASIIPVIAAVGIIVFHMSPAFQMGQMASTKAALATTNLAIIERHRDLLAADVTAITQDLAAGTLQRHTASTPLQPGADQRDPLTRPLMEAAFRLGVGGRGAARDLSAGIPFVPLHLSQQIVTLYSPLAQENVRRRGQSDTDAITYRGVSVVNCLLGADGELLSLSTMPSGLMVDMTRFAEMRPIADLCQSLASDTEAPSTLSFG